MFTYWDIYRPFYDSEIKIRNNKPKMFFQDKANNNITLIEVKKMLQDILKIID